MSSYLQRLTARALGGDGSGLAPRRPSRFEPDGGAGAAFSLPAGDLDSRWQEPGAAGADVGKESRSAAALGSGGETGHGVSARPAAAAATDPPAAPDDLFNAASPSSARVDRRVSDPRPAARAGQDGRRRRELPPLADPRDRRGEEATAVRAPSNSRGGPQVPGLLAENLTPGVLVEGRYVARQQPWVPSLLDPSPAVPIAIESVSAPRSGRSVRRDGLQPNSTGDARADRHDGDAGAEPVIHVTIGRIEVRAARPAKPKPRPARAAAAPRLSLDDYQRRRREGGA